MPDHLAAPLVPGPTKTPVGATAQVVRCIPTFVRGRDTQKDWMVNRECANGSAATPLGRISACCMRRTSLTQRPATNHAHQRGEKKSGAP